MHSADNHPFTLTPLEDRLLLSATLLSAGATAMVYDPAGALHVAYYDTAAHALKYTARSPAGAWDPAITLDPTPYAGAELSIALDATGRPAVAYYDATNRDLKFAQKTHRGWTIQTLDSAGTVGHNPSLAFTPDGFPLVSYYAASTADLRLASFNGTRWYVSTIDATGSVGRFSDLAISPLDGSWAIAYESQSDHTIRYAQKWGKSFTTRTLDTLPGDATWLAKPSLAFNSTGNPLVSYTDRDALILNRAGRKSWTRSTIVDSGVTSPDTTLFVQSDAPRLLYAHAGQFALSSATPTNTWLTADLISTLPLATARTGDRIGLLAADATVTTVDPSAPPALAVSAHLEFGLVHVTWTNAPADAVSFTVERTVAGAGDWHQVADVSPGTDEYWDNTGITLGAAYEYRVCAVGGAIVAPFWSTAAIEISVPAPTLTATPKPWQEIDLHWQDWTPSAGYLEVERAVAGTTDFEPRLTSDYGSGLLLDTGEAGVDYVYRARLHAGADLVSGWTTVTVGFSLPIGGVTLQVYQVTSSPASWGQGHVDLVWSGLPADAEYVTIERTPVGGGDPQILWAWAGAGGYSDYTPESEGVSYTYRIRLSNEVAISDFTPAVRADLPPAMGDNIGVNWTGGAVFVRWFDFSNHELGYRIERSANDDAHFETIAELVEPDQNGGYVDTTAVERTVYYYRVTAIGEFSESEPLENWVATDFGLPTNLAAQVRSPSQVHLTWKDNSNYEDHFNLMVSTDGTTFTPWGSNLPADTTQLDLDHLTRGQTYWFEIRSYNRPWYDTNADPVVRVDLPLTLPGAAPADLQATAGSSTVHLTWVDETSDETAWRIQRSDDGGNTFATLIDLPAGTQTFDDAGLSAAKAYVYRVLPISAGTPGAAATGTALTAPILVRAVDLSPDVISLTWDPISSDVESLDIVYLSPKDGKIHTMAHVIDPSLGHARVWGLEDGSSFGNLKYTVWLVASGPGGATASDTITVGTSLHTLSLTVVSTGPASVDLSWVDLYPQPGEVYGLWYSTDGVTYTQCLPESGATSATISGLQPDTTYWFRLGRWDSWAGHASLADPVIARTSLS